MSIVQNKICQIIFIASIMFGISVKTKAQQISTAEFAESLKNAKNPQILDARTAGEYGGGHLISAKNIDVKEDDFESKIIALDKTRPVYVYCLSGGRSKIAHEKLEKNDILLLKWQGAT